MINSQVLVLNQNYEPLNICRARRALVLLFRGKVEVVENGAGAIRTAFITYPLPSVIRLTYMIKRPRPQRQLTRFQVFSRDHFTCQYCGRETRDLTLDHVTPRHLGGEHTWENVVSACVPCNRRKAGKFPSEAGMKLIRSPFRPKPDGFYIPYHLLRAHHHWHKFLPQ
ncbi:MAG: HNH endonuclease [Dehalococcoidia bacterium]